MKPNFKKNLKQLLLIISVSLFVYSCKPEEEVVEKLNKKSSNKSATFLSASQSQTSSNVEIHYFDSTGNVSLLWTADLKSNNLDSFFNAVQIKSDQIILFVDSTGKTNRNGPCYFGIFNKYNGTVIQNFKAPKNYKYLHIARKPIYNPNNGHIYFWGSIKKTYSDKVLNGILKLDLSNNEISVIDTNYYYPTLDETNNILYGLGLDNKILKLNLTTNNKEEISFGGTNGPIAFMHYVNDFKKLIIGGYAPGGQDNLTLIDINTKQFSSMKTGFKIGGGRGQYEDASDNLYSFLEVNKILMYNFKNETMDTININNGSMSNVKDANYFQLVK